MLTIANRSDCLSTGIHRAGWRTVLYAICLLACMAVTPSAMAQAASGNCGGIENNDGGPWDYRNRRHPKLGVVEAHHFTPKVENLFAGQSGASIGADLDFTLRAFPNHHRALLALVRYGEKLKSPQPSGTRISIDCYFQHAVTFRPDDHIARMIYATYLVKLGRHADAQSHLEIVATKADDNAFTHYNIGLIYMDMKNYDRALTHAHLAYGLGIQQPDLRDQLKAAGKWSEPVTESPAAIRSDANGQTAQPGGITIPK